MDHELGDFLELDQQVCFALAVASRNVIHMYRPILEPLGLTHPQYLVMLAVWGRKSVRFKELAALLRLDPATLSPIVKRLEQAELVKREPVEGDERTFAVTSTEKGWQLREKAVAVPPAVIKKLGMPLERLVALREELALIIEATDGK